MQRFYARQTICKEISWNDASNFTKQYHRDKMPRNCGANKIAYGLWYHNQLLAVAMFCNPRTKQRMREYTTELLRLTFKNDVHITGGASKLIKTFLREKSPVDLFTYQTTSGENTNVYLFSGMTERKSRSKAKTVIVKNGYTYETAKQHPNQKLWYSMLSVRLGPDNLLGTNLGEQFDNTGRRLTNIELFLKLGYHEETIPGDRIFEWFNPNITHYIYKIADNNDNYYIGRHLVHHSYSETIAIQKENPTIDTYYGSGGQKFQNWLNKVGAENTTKTILQIVPTHKKASYYEQKYIDLDDPLCKNTRNGDSAQPYFNTQSTCSTCGTTNRIHKPTCPSYNPACACTECGSRSPGHHKRTCSQFKGISTCPECHGPKGRHRKTCSKFQRRTCTECGGVSGSHFKTCTFYKQDYCNECGGSVHSHRHTCSKYTRKPYCCKYCGTHNKGNHNKSCPQYKQSTLCPLCGTARTHKKSCPNYNRKPKRTCDECGHVMHIKTCSKYKPRKTCPACGWVNHKSDCPLKPSNQKQ